MMIWKGYGRKWLWSNFKVPTWHLPGGTEKTMKNLCQDSQSPSRDFNMGPPEYETGVLIT
jgi:hypothetical protein